MFFGILLLRNTTMLFVDNQRIPYLTNTIIYILFHLFRSIDSHHKLIRWRFVIHGCIDGFSRLMIYLHCCNDNTSETVRNLFQEKVECFYWPPWVRSNQGMENIGVSQLMLVKFAPENVPQLTGLSVHNQRIERLWRDVVTYIFQHYRDLFEFMESISILDPLNECHLFVVYLIYQPRLDKALKDFISFWNNHKLRTEWALTPM